MSQVSLFPHDRPDDSYNDDTDYTVLNCDRFIDRMRWVAKDIAEAEGQVSSDDLREYADEHRIKPSTPNAWGQILNDKRFRETHREPSRWPSNNRRKIGVYMWIGSPTSW